MRVVLDADDLLEVAHYAQVRDAVMTWKDTPHRKVDPRRTTEEITWLGRFGEMVVARALGEPLPPFHAAADRGYDLTYLGRTLQVKTTTYDPGTLVMFESGPARFKAEIAILVVKPASGRVQLRDYQDGVGRIAGWCWREEFEARAQRHDFGYGERLIMRERELSPFATLIALPCGR